MGEHRGTGAQAATARVVARKLSTPLVDLPAWARSGWRVQRGREELPPAAQLLSKAARARQGDISETRSLRGRPRTGLGPSPPRPQPGGCDPQHRLTAATPKPPSLQAMDGVRDPKPSASVIGAQRPPLPAVWLPPRASTHRENPQSSSLSLPLPPPQPPPQTPNPRPLRSTASGWHGLQLLNSQSSFLRRLGLDTRDTWTNHWKVSSPDHVTPCGQQNGWCSNHALAFSGISVCYHLAREATLKVQVLLCVPVGYPGPDGRACLSLNPSRRGTRPGAVCPGVISGPRSWELPKKGQVCCV
ncbi:uncharacterized protein LOC121101187 [Ursus maritimus]|uniref:Uncharacterized protein LOC121101187 n=1 Tax=Ursus maritimus TaxID=29073 RepID=A0A8M1F8G6_URSMA|nr:uncharacterized protein LOC121101187 [Ursus maritimus]